MDKRILIKRNEILQKNADSVNGVTAFSQQKLADESVFEKFLNPDPIYIDTRKLEDKLPKNDFVISVNEYRVSSIQSLNNKESEASKCNGFYKKIAKDIETENKKATERSILQKKDFLNSQQTIHKKYIPQQPQQPQQPASFVITPQMLAKIPVQLHMQLHIPGMAQHILKYYGIRVEQPAPSSLSSVVSILGVQDTPDLPHSERPRIFTMPPPLKMMRHSK